MKANTDTKTKATTVKTVNSPKATAKKAVATLKKDTVVGMDENGNMKDFPNPMNPPEKVEMSTDVFSKEMLTELNKRTQAIRKCQGRIDSSFETIAFNLYWIASKEAYKAEGCDSIVKYADEYFGYAKTTCYSLIAVVDRFAKRDESGHYLEELDERVKGYSVSKLSLMVGLTDEQISRLTPDMSVRDIKRFVKSLECKPMPELPDGNGEEEETGEKDNSDNIVNSTAKEVNRQLLISCKGREDYENRQDKVFEIIERALKLHPEATVEIAYVLP